MTPKITIKPQASISTRFAYHCHIEIGPGHNGAGASAAEALMNAANAWRTYDAGVPKKSLTMIVCHDERQARYVRKEFDPWCNTTVITPTASQLMGKLPRRVVVYPGVDLEADINGYGSLRSILKKRQLAWGDQAEFIVL